MRLEVGGARCHHCRRLAGMGVSSLSPPRWSQCCGLSLLLSVPSLSSLFHPRSTPKQLLMRLGAGGVSFVTVGGRDGATHQYCR